MGCTMRLGTRTRPLLSAAAWCRLIALLAVVLGLTRIVRTYPVFNQTFDEPAHIAGGMEWLDRGTYRLEPQHPPLARVAAALGPYLLGLRYPSDTEPAYRARSGLGPRRFRVGSAILETGGQYLRNLSFARLGLTPFFVMAALVVWRWCRKEHGDAAAVAAVLMFTALPPILGHGGLATTDMAATTTLAAALFFYCGWLDRPTLGSSALLGVAGAASVLSKLSALVYLAAGIACIYAVKVWLTRRPARRLPQEEPAGETEVGRLGWLPAIAVVAVVGFIVIWPAYRFSVSYPATFGGHLWLPAPELARGIAAVKEHNTEGHPSYLLGQVGATGWWYFFPVALSVKTPIPFGLFALAGCVHAARLALRTGQWSAVSAPVAAVAILAVAMASRIDIGVRHVLPVYALLAIPAGAAIRAAWHARKHVLVARGTATGLASWLAISSIRAHPDYLAYFNEVAGSHPEHFLINSDLDWGQDYLRLVDSVRARHLDTVWVAYFGTLDTSLHALPGMRPLPPHRPTEGWVAASIYMVTGIGSDEYTWLRGYEPVFRAGRSIWVFHIRRPMRLGRHD